MLRFPVGRLPSAALPGTHLSIDALPVTAPSVTVGLAQGIELLGEYQGSGRTLAPYLVRRSDGRMLEVSPLLHLVATHLDGERDLIDVAHHVSADLGRPISARSVAYLIDRKLRPLGVVDDVGAPASAALRRPPVLGPGMHAGVIPGSVVRAVTGVLRPLFLPPVVGAVLLGLVGVDSWLLTHYDVGRSVRDLAFDPGLLLLVIGLTVGAGVFHELGHATASRYGGAEPGVIGAGVYLIWPVFYNDLNDSYRLTRMGRLRADLGGVYFNVVFILVLAALYRLTGFQPLLVVVVVQHLSIAQQFLPFVRLDGYYIVSDLAGVPDLFGRIRPILSALVPGRTRSSEVTGLKPTARAVVTAWVVATVPLLTGCALLLVASLPALMRGAWESLGIQADMLIEALRDGAPFGFLLSALQILALAVPFIGLSALARRVLGGRVVRRPPRRGPEAAAPGSTRARCGCLCISSHLVRPALRRLFR